MEQLFEKYQNIQLFATKPEYRNFTLLDKEGFYDYETFKNKIHAFEYILHKFKNPKDGKQIDIYLFKHDSRYITNTTQFKKILDRYSDHNIIMITKEELNVYRRKMISQYTNLNIKNYLYKHFIIELNKGPLCSKHTILSPEEIRTISYNIMAHAHKLPAIFENDPQNIWIGGEINDLIKIESFSEITGKSITYRIVTPSSGKIQQVQKIAAKKEELLETDIKNVDEVIEEIDEVIEGNDDDFIDDYIEE